MSTGTGLPGRPRKPTAAKIAAGNPGKRKPPADEPQPEVGAPDRPAHVATNAVASGEWDRIVKLTTATRVLTVADGPILEMTALAYAEYRIAQKATAKSLTYKVKTAAGSFIVKPRPEVPMAADAWRRYVNGLTHFGLTPATRAKVHVTKPAAPASPLDEFGTHGPN